MQAFAEFHLSRRSGRQAWCKACRRAYDRAYWQRTRLRRLELRRVRQRELVESFQRLKSETCCADCGGFFHFAAMQWDHLPGAEKLDEVSTLVRKGKTNRAREEIAKCELVCANCHAVRSYERLIGA
jgi:hypothetical protein